jgi:hypothetical protein
VRHKHDSRAKKLISGDSLFSHVLLYLHIEYFHLSANPSTQRPAFAMRLTAELINFSLSYLNPLKERELDLRGKPSPRIPRLWKEQILHKGLVDS